MRFMIWRGRIFFVCSVLVVSALIGVGIVAVLLCEVLDPKYLTMLHRGIDEVQSKGDKGPLTYGESMTPSYFFDTYEDSKNAFRSLAERLATTLPELDHGEVVSKEQAGVKFDYCYFPPREDPTKLLVITSGVHGVEAYVGSAVQLMVIERHAEALVKNGWGLILLHGINDFGFRHFQRVTEENIDLNRNFLVPTDSFAERARSSHYHHLENLLGPKGLVAADWSARLSFFLRVLYSLAYYGKKQLRQVILEGQYSHAEGIYFGGNTHGPVVPLVRSFLQPLLDKYAEVVSIDLHTGYGNRGELHLFPNKTTDKAVRQATEDLFRGYRIDWGDSDDFYVVQGDFITFVGSLLSEKTSYIPMVFEYGTVNNLGLLNSLRSLLLMIWENQGRRYGFVNYKVEQNLRRAFREHYYPSDTQWRDRVIADTDRLIRRVFLTR
jgi:Protein of unknown function (DUF2817)